MPVGRSPWSSRLRLSSVVDAAIGASAKWPGTSTSGRRRSERACVSQAETDGDERRGLTAEERTELSQLRRENRRLSEDNETLKRATAYFARETR